MSEESAINPAKGLQVIAMKEYISQCHGLFERMITELLVQQPEDPHEFLVEEMKRISNEEKEELVRNVQKTLLEMKQFNPSGDGKVVSRPKTVQTEKVGIQESLKLELTMDKKGSVQAAKETLLSSFLELRDAAQETGKCMSFKIFYDSATSVMCVVQEWRTSEALSAFKASPFYEAMVPRFAGLTNSVTVTSYAQHLA